MKRTEKKHPNCVEFQRLLSIYLNILTFLSKKVINFLSIWVTQTDHGISLDQGECIHILLLHHHSDQNNTNSNVY
jgi:hypothetical protein